MVFAQDNSMSRAVGRRKTAAARVRLVPGKGDILINNKLLKDYFGTQLLRDKVMAPLKTASKENTFDISIKIAGGGVNSQAEAVRHGIARALVQWNPEFRAILKAEGYLTRDPRAKERKKFGRRRARRGHQWRKR